MHKQRNSAAASHTFPSKIATTKQKQQQQQRIKFLLEMRPKQELKVDPELYKAAAPRRCKKMPRGTFKLFDWNKPELVEARTEGRFCFKCDKVFDGKPNKQPTQPGKPSGGNSGTNAFRNQEQTILFLWYIRPVTAGWFSIMCVKKASEQEKCVIAKAQWALKLVRTQRLTVTSKPDLMIANR